MGGVFKSSNGGGNWTAVSQLNQAVDALVLDSSSPPALYAGAENSGIFVYPSGGSSWKPLNSGLTNTDIRSLAINPSVPATIYSGSHGDGIFTFSPSATPACGSSNLKTLSSAPTDLCTSGTPSAIAGSGPWSWSCQGSNIAETALCITNKQTVTYIQSDVAGSWEFNQLASGPAAPWWARGSSTIASDGTFSGTLTVSDGSTDVLNGTITVAADGTVNVPRGNPDISCKLDSSKTIITCTDTWSSWKPGTVELMIMTKMAPSYSLDDLAGSWSFNSYKSPGAYWERGTLVVAAGGGYSLVSDGSDGGHNTETGTLEISASGVVTRTGIPISSSRCVLDALKTVLVCTSTSSSGSSGMQILTKNGANYTQSDLIGVWNYSNIASPDQWYGRGLANFTADGNIAVSYYGSDGISDYHAGPYSISSSGSITGASPSGSCSMDALKRLVACVTLNSKGTNADLMIYTSAKPTPVPSAPVNGACGSSNLKTLPAAPTGNLCLAGTASAVSGSGPWTWSCQGANGGDDAFCLANKQTMVFTTADMAGIWLSNGIESPGPWWSRGTFAVAADGSFSSTDMTASDGPRPPLSGSYVVSSDGIMTAPAFGPPFRCVIDPAETVTTCTNSNKNGKEMIISVRKAASYSLADLSGSWESHAIATPGPYWSHGSFTVAADGTSSATVTQNNGSTTNFSGTFSMPSDGIFTLTSPQLQPIEQATMRCVLDSLKTVMVCTYTHGSSSSLETTMWVYVKKAAAYSQGDLTGAWHVNNLVSPKNPWWGRGMFSMASDGSFVANMNGSDGPGDIMSFTGTGTFSPNGNFAFSGVPTGHCSMDAAKRLIACTNTSTTGSGDATILVMTAASAPRAGQCGSSNGGTFSTAPTADLCAGGLPSAVNGSGPWSWICQGIRGGTATCSASLPPPPEHTLAVSISGSGTVNSVTPGVSFSCASAACSHSFADTTSLTLAASPSFGSLFSGWSGACAAPSGNCTVSMSADRNLTASFVSMPPLRIPDVPARYFNTLSAAFASMTDNSNVELHARSVTLANGFTLARPVSLTLSGGFDAGFATDNGMTVIEGGLVIQAGSLTVSKIIVR